MRPILFVAALSVAAGSAGVGAFGQAPGRAVLDGLVVLTVDGRPSPVRRARVVVHSDVATETTDTDTEGRFHLDGLRAGTYHVDITKFGFVPVGRVPAVMLADGQHQTATFPMQRGAAIEGRVMTEAGEPVAGIGVAAVRLGFGPYGRTAVAIQQTTTDDLGYYRVHTLAAGAYYLQVAPDPGLMINATTIPGQTRIPTRTYYSGGTIGTARLNDARPIPVDTAQQLTGVDVTVITGVATTVRARVATSSGARPASFSFRLERVGAPPGDVLCFTVPGRDAEPTATCGNVPPGDYWALATSRPAPKAPVEFSMSRLTVDGRDLPELAVTTAPGAPVAGTIEAEGAALPPNLRVTAVETEYELPAGAPGGGLSAPPVPAQADGTFAFASLGGPRLIRVVNLPAGWAVKSVWLGNVDIADTPTAFESIGAAAALRVVVTNQTGTVAGLVLNAAGQADEGARVVVFAKDNGRWGARSRYIAAAEVGPEGRYVIGGLLPGEYLVAVRGFMEDGAWTDPDELATLQATAVPARVGAGATATVDWRPR